MKLSEKTIKQILWVLEKPKGIFLVPNKERKKELIEYFRVFMSDKIVVADEDLGIKPDILPDNLIMDEYNERKTEK